MSDSNKKTTRTVKKFDKRYWDMTPEEKMAYVSNLFVANSPNEEVRKTAK